MSIMYDDVSYFDYIFALQSQCVLYFIKPSNKFKKTNYAITMCVYRLIFFPKIKQKRRKKKEIFIIFPFSWRF